MPKVDSKGRIVLPQELRERLDIGPGEEVDVHEENGRVVVEPERSPGEIIDRMEELIAGISNREPTPYGELDPQAKDHVDTIRSQAENGDE